MTLKVSVTLCYLIMSYDPLSGDLGSFDPVRVEPTVRSPLGQLTVHAFRLATSKVFQIIGQNSTTQVDSYRVGEADVFNIWD